MSILGEPLKDGDALKQFEAFKELKPDPGLPEAVCYRMSEIIKFYVEANDMFAENKVPEEERGIAMMLGVHIMPDGSKGKPTIMMVATRYRDDPKNRQVLAIQNPVITEGEWDSAPGEIGDVAFDAGSLWP